MCIQLMRTCEHLKIYFVFQRFGADFGSKVLSRNHLSYIEIKAREAVSVIGFTRASQTSQQFDSMRQMLVEAWVGLRMNALIEGVEFFKKHSNLKEDAILAAERLAESFRITLHCKGIIAFRKELHIGLINTLKTIFLDMAQTYHEVYTLDFKAATAQEKTFREQLHSGKPLTTRI